MQQGGVLKTIASGIVIIGLVTAFGLHASQLAQLPKPTGQAFSNVLNTAEKG